METLPTDRRAVEATVATLQERLADGDPADWVCPLCGVGKDEFEPQA